MTEKLTLTRPDDWHLHVRDGGILTDVVPATAACFGRAIIMPNLVPPITTAADATAYRERILAAAKGTAFEPLMTLYLTESLTPETIREAKAAGVVAAKLYPAGATTNSDSGVKDIRNIYPVLEAMADCSMLLLVHGEVTDADIDIFDREKVFIERVLAPTLEAFPNLKVVLEHITHLYCLPILKRNRHQKALRDAVASGDKRFFLGTDSAPHAKDRKEAACGCAGCYSAYGAIGLYADIFEELGILDKLEAFASFNGPDFYGLPRNTDTITLVREPWTMPAELPLADGTIVPLKAGETVHWRLA